MRRGEIYYPDLSPTVDAEINKRRPGTTKAAPARARALKKQGRTVSEIAQALGVKERMV